MSSRIASGNIAHYNKLACAERIRLGIFGQSRAVRQMPLLKRVVGVYKSIFFAASYPGLGKLQREENQGPNRIETGNQYTPVDCIATVSMPQLFSQSAKRCKSSVKQANCRTEPTTRVQFYQELAERIRHLPGVTATGAISALPLTSAIGWGGMHIEGYVPPPNEPELQVDGRSATPPYFSAMQIPLIRGRMFAETDTNKMLWLAKIAICCRIK